MAEKMKNLHLNINQILKLQGKTERSIFYEKMSTLVAGIIYILKRKTAEIFMSFNTLFHVFDFFPMIN